MRTGDGTAGEIESLATQGGDTTAVIRLCDGREFRVSTRHLQIQPDGMFLAPFDAAATHGEPPREFASLY